MAPIPGLEHAGPSEDALAWWVVYSLVRHARVAKSGTYSPCHITCPPSQAMDLNENSFFTLTCTGGVSPIERQWQEIDQIAGAHVRRGMRVSSDPLGCVALF